MQKKTLRNMMKSQLKSISSSRKRSLEMKFYQYLFQSSLWNSAQRIGITMSQTFEWDTKPIIEKALKERKAVAVPKCLPEDKLLYFYKFQSFHRLEKGYGNILEPIVGESTRIKNENLDLLIVPGIVFDERGYRIGFGGGYYDRFLQNFQNKSLSIAAEWQVIQNIPIEKHDIPVQYIITEKRIIHCKREREYNFNFDELL